MLTGTVEANTVWRNKTAAPEKAVTTNNSSITKYIVYFTIYDSMKWCHIQP